MSGAKNIDISARLLAYLQKEKRKRGGMRMPDILEERVRELLAKRGWKLAKAEWPVEVKRIIVSPWLAAWLAKERKRQKGRYTPVILDMLVFGRPQ